MNQAELYQLLLESGLTVYRDWADTPAPLSLPHVVIQVPRDRGLGGDLSRLADWHMVRLELWSRRADLAAEGSIRRVLDRIGGTTPWSGSPCRSRVYMRQYLNLRQSRC